MSQAVAQNIRSIRQHNNWSQEFLASQAGVDVRSVQRAEKGEASEETIHAVALALKVSPELLAVDFKAALAEAKSELAKYDQVQLTTPASGSDIAREISGWTRTFNSVDLDTDEQKDFVAEFQQLVSDYGDIWEGLEFLDKRGAEKELQEYVDKLSGLGLIVGVGSSTVMLGTKPGRNMVMVVCKKEEPKTMVLVPKYQL
jgi:transcriptional regulator with XRE-family HTH domain